MELTPIPGSRSAALAVGFYAWGVFRFWLGQRFRDRDDWSPSWDGFSLGVVASAAVVVALRLLGV